MPLTYLLYRCPRCGNDPLQGTKDRARCSSCGSDFARAGPGGVIRVRDPSGEQWIVPAHRLVAAMEEWEGDPSAQDPPETPSLSAWVRARYSGQEAPVRWGGELLGFAEAMGPAEEGILTLAGEELILETSATPGGDGRGQGPEAPGEERRWHLKEIRAVQTSSSSLQFSPAAGGLVELRFVDDSPFRWESRLRNALRALYRRKGLGEIVEFQPRIVTE